MPAFAAMAVNDGQGTPVSHTFSPIDIDKNGVAIHMDQSGGIPIGYLKLGVSLRLPSSPTNGMQSDANKRVIRVKLSCDVPVLETLASGASGYTPPPTVAFVNRGTCEFIFPERSTLQNRKDVRAYIANALGLTYIKNVVEDLQAIY